MNCRTHGVLLAFVALILPTTVQAHEFGIPHGHHEVASVLLVIVLILAVAFVLRFHLGRK